MDTYCQKPSFSFDQIYFEGKLGRSKQEFSSLILCLPRPQFFPVGFFCLNHCASMCLARVLVTFLRYRKASGPLVMRQPSWWACLWSLQSPAPPEPQGEVTVPQGVCHIWPLSEIAVLPMVASNWENRSGREIMENTGGSLWKTEEKECARKVSTWTQINS